MYTIFVDPNKSSVFPGVATILRLATSISSSVKASSQRVRSLLSSEPKTAPDEHDPLLSDYFNQPTSVEYDSDLDGSLSPGSVTRDPRRRYSTFSNRRNEQAHKSREVLLFRFCIASFVTSFVLLGIAAKLASKGRMKSVMTVNLGIMVDVICSLVFAIAGVGTMMARQNNLGWVHRALVLLVLAIICVGNGVLLAVLGGRGHF